MPTLTVRTERTEWVTFVEAIVEADDPHRVRLEWSIDGPVFPPRDDGQPVEEFDDRGVTIDVTDGATPVGFATTGTLETPVLEIVETEPWTPGLPADGVATWFDRIEHRLNAAESLASVDDLASATAAVRSVGGLAAVESLAADVERDRRLLDQLSITPDGLQKRADRVEIPTEAFARLLGE